MTTTYKLIAKQTVGSGGAASVTFSNIPQTFTDLKLVLSSRNSRSDGTAFATVQFSFNGVTTNRSRRNLYNVSGTTGSDSGSDIISVGTSSSATSNTFDNMEVYIPNYTSSNNKSMSIDSTTENNGTAVYQILGAGLWSSSSAINQITITPTSYNWVEFSEFWLYGISSSSTQNTSVPLASGGDVITTDGTYWYHTFLYSGTFTPLKNLTCDYLVVAGGGGSSGSSAGGIGGGGGGAGGYKTSIGGSALSLSNSVYTVTVGAGGAAGAYNTDAGNGNDSLFAGSGITTITLTGGGRGINGYATNTAGNGGSGGGGGYNKNGGTGISGQGNNGGNGSISTSSGAGGGGAGAAGTTVTTDAGGAGGIGLSNSISGSAVYYAGGGGGGGQAGAGFAGGTGGTGGGGNGGGVGSTAGVAGTANRGGGAGGGARDGSNTTSGANGGSGIIIVRYAV